MGQGQRQVVAVNLTCGHGGAGEGHGFGAVIHPIGGADAGDGDPLLGDLADIRLCDGELAFGQSGVIILVVAPGDIVPAQGESDSDVQLRTCVLRLVFSGGGGNGNLVLAHTGNGDAVRLLSHSVGAVIGLGEAVWHIVHRQLRRGDGHLDLADLGGMVAVIDGDHVPVVVAGALRAGAVGDVLDGDVIFPDVVTCVRSRLGRALGVLDDVPALKAIHSDRLVFQAVGFAVIGSGVILNGHIAHFCLGHVDGDGPGLSAGVVIVAAVGDLQVVGVYGDGDIVVRPAAVLDLVLAIRILVEGVDQIAGGLHRAVARAGEGGLFIVGDGAAGVLGIKPAVLVPGHVDGRRGLVHRQGVGGGGVAVVAAVVCFGLDGDGHRCALCRRLVEGHLAVTIHAGDGGVGALVCDLGARLVLAHVALAGDGESSVAQGLGHRFGVGVPAILAGVIRRQLDGLRGFGDGDLVGSDISRIVLGIDDRGDLILAHIGELDVAVVGCIGFRITAHAIIEDGIPLFAGVGQGVRGIRLLPIQNPSHHDAVDGLGRAGVGVFPLRGVADGQGRLGDLKRIPGDSRDVVVVLLLAIGEDKVDLYLVAARVRRSTGQRLTHQACRVIFVFRPQGQQILGICTVLFDGDICRCVIGLGGVGGVVHRHGGRGDLLGHDLPAQLDVTRAAPGPLIVLIVLIVQ